MFYMTPTCSTKTQLGGFEILVDKNHRANEKPATFRANPKWMGYEWGTLTWKSDISVQSLSAKKTNIKQVSYG